VDLDAEGEMTLVTRLAATVSSSPMNLAAHKRSIDVARRVSLMCICGPMLSVDILGDQFVFADLNLAAMAATPSSQLL
jgi:hypothetical protein